MKYLFHHAYRLMFNRQQVLLPIAIFLALCAISFRFNNQSTQWLWNNKPFIPVFLLSLTFLMVWIWMKIEKSKMQATMAMLKQQYQKEESLTKDKLSQLSNRELQVFELIKQGKSNKEICADLFIELSTLKSHINRIYKKLEIKNRKEVRNI